MTSSSIVNKGLEFVRSMLNESQDADVYELCNVFGIEVIDSYPMDKEGYLICSDGMKLIFIDSNIVNRHRKRFIVAHELGHYIMHQSQLFCCSNIEDRGIFETNSPVQEKQANEFASELILPKWKVSNEFRDRVTFDKISYIANKFDVSITMTAIKCIACSKTEEEILLCYDTKGKLKWYVSSSRYIGRRQIPNRCPISLVAQNNIVKTWGHWDSIYDGDVDQELFQVTPNQVLVLLAGNKWRFVSSSYE